jgi:hypothetical protein
MHVMGTVWVVLPPFHEVVNMRLNGFRWIVVAVPLEELDLVDGDYPLRIVAIPEGDSFTAFVLTEKSHHFFRNLCVEFGQPDFRLHHERGCLPDPMKVIVDGVLGSFIDDDFEQVRHLSSPE